jgi:hypothetical protein
METQKITIGGKVARPRMETDMEMANDEKVVSKWRKLVE